MKKYIIPIILIVLTFSCRKELDIDIPDNERKIVLNTIAMNDSVFSANVFRSNHVQDGKMELLYLNNATVSLFENGSLIETLSLDSDGYYLGSTTTAQVGHEYEITVSVPNLESVTAKATVLHQIPITSIDSTGVSNYENYYGYYEEGANEFITYDVKFQDIPNEKNYYRLKINAPMVADTFFYYDNETDSLIYDIYYTSIYSYTEDPVIEVWAWLDGYYYFSDILFDGDEYEFEFGIQLPSFEDKGYKNEIIMSDISVSLEHISYDMFNYMRSIDMQNDTEGMEMFFQSVPVFINVENGFGIFGTANSSKEHLP